MPNNTMLNAISRYTKCLLLLWLILFAEYGFAAKLTEDSDAVTEVDQPQKMSAVEQRLFFEETENSSRYVITPHKQNYLIPLSYNWKVNKAPYSQPEDIPEELEMKFQFSFKIPIKRQLFSERYGLHFAYTQLSFWQAYNSAASAPFRDNNYEPELFLSMRNDTKLYGLTNRLILFGLSHQSNGRSRPLSRGWNRFYVNFILEKDNFALSLKPWWRIPEGAATDDNPDIEKFMGHGELTAVYKDGEDVYSLMLRNNFHGENYGAMQLDWSFPISDRINGYVQYFNGYGESLIDYNAQSHRLGIGILLTNWL